MKQIWKEHTIKERVLFIDQSTTRVGWTVLSNGLIVPQPTHVLKGESVYRRVMQLMDFYRQELARIDPHRVFCEGGTWQRGWGEAQRLPLAAAEFLLRNACWERKVPIDTIHNQTLKSNIIRLAEIDVPKGESKDKKWVQAAVRKLFELDAEAHLDPDQADSLAMAALYAYGKHVPPPKKPRRAAKTPAQPESGHRVPHQNGTAS